MINVNLNLQGKFKFDVYNKNDTLDYSTDYILNFITPTGLNYIKDYAIADCFRYVSVGTGTGLNTVLGDGTTGLDFPLLDYSYIGGNPNPCGVNGRINHYVRGACGYRVDKTGLSLFRGWRVPESGKYFDNDYNLSEFMVSPGPHRLNGYLGGAKSVCHCNESVYEDISEIGATKRGIESIDFYTYYPNICNANKAFARVIRNLPVSRDQFLIIHYSLYVSVNSGVVPFGFTTGRINPYDGDDGEGIHNWSGVSGLYSLIHYGIKPINDGTVNTVPGRTQISNSNYLFRFGESFIPFFGYPLEPSCPMANRVGYLTSDNIHFLVNFQYGGAMTSTGTYQPFNPSGELFPSGVCYFKPELIEKYADSNITDNNYGKLLNMRRPASNYQRPLNTDFQQSMNYTPLEVVSSQVTGVNINLANTGRERSFSVLYRFDNENSTSRIPSRAFVKGYTESISSNGYYPFLDMVFYPKDSGGFFAKDPVPDILKTSGITFSTLVIPTGVNDYPPVSVDVTSPFNSIIPISERQVISGNSTFIPTGWFFTDVPRNKHRVLLTNGGGAINSQLVGAGNTVDPNDVKLYCYATPIYNSGYISGLTWTGEFLPEEAVTLRSYNNRAYFPTNDYPTAPDKTYWPSLHSFTTDSVVYPSWLLTGENCVFCTGAYNGSPISPAQVVMEITDGIYYLIIDNTFESYTKATFNPGLLTTYSLPSGAFTVGQTGGYSYIDWNNQLTAKFHINWASPCSSGVIGC